MPSVSRFLFAVLIASACGGKSSTGPTTPPNASAMIVNTTTDALTLSWALSQDVVQPAITTASNGSAAIASRQQRCVRIALPSVDGSTGVYELQLLDNSSNPPVIIGLLDITAYTSSSAWTFSGVGNYGGYVYLQPTITGSLC